MIVALPGCELIFQRGSPYNGRSIIISNFNMLGIMHMGNREQNRRGDDT